MSLRPLFIVSALAAVILGGCSGGPRGIQSDDSPGSAKGLVPRTLAQTPFQFSWNLSFGEPVHRAWTAPETPDLLYVQLRDSRRVVAVEALTGATRWVSQELPDLLTLPATVTRIRLPTNQPGVTINDDRLYLIAQDVLHVLDVRTGHLVWRYELPFSASTAPTAVGYDSSLRVFIGDWSGRMQVVSFNQERGFPYPVWQWPIGTSIGATPIHRDELVYAGDHAGILHCFKQDREQAWQRPLGGGIYGSPLVQNRLLMAGTTDGLLVAINRLTGEELGKMALGGPVVRAPVAFRGEPDRVYVWVGSDETTQTLVAVQAQADTVAFTDTARHPLEVVRLGELWRRPAFERLIASSPEYLYGTARESTLVQALNRRTGRIDWVWDASAVFPRSDLEHLVTYQDPRDRLRMIYAIDDDGLLVAHRFFGAVPTERPDPEDLPAAPAPAAKPKADAAPAAAPAP